jgi:hypothetical protein
MMDLLPSSGEAKEYEYLFLLSKTSVIFSLKRKVAGT